MGRVLDTQLLTYGDINAIMARAEVAQTGTNYTNTGGTISFTNNGVVTSGYSFTYKYISPYMSFYANQQCNFKLTFTDKISCFSTASGSRNISWINHAKVYLYYNSTYHYVQEHIFTGQTSNCAGDSTTRSTTVSSVYASSAYVNTGSSLSARVYIKNEIELRLNGPAVTENSFTCYYSGTTTVNTLTMGTANYLSNSAINRFITYSAVHNLSIPTSYYVCLNEGVSSYNNRFVTYENFYKQVTVAIASGYSTVNLGATAGSYCLVGLTYTTDRSNTIDSSCFSGMPYWLEFAGYSSPYITMVATYTNNNGGSRSVTISITPKDCRVGTSFTIIQLST